MLTNCTPLIAPIELQQHGIELSMKKPNVSANLLENTIMKSNMISESCCSGSAYIEIDGTKVLCTVLGPYAALKGGVNDTCLLECDLKCAPYCKDINLSNEDIILSSAAVSSPSVILESALKPTIFLEKYPKCIITVNVVILEVSSMLYIHTFLYLYTYLCYPYIPIYIIYILLCSPALDTDWTLPVPQHLQPSVQPSCLPPSL